MKMIRWMTFAAAIAVLGACGSGGPEAGTPAFGNSATAGGSDAGGGAGTGSGSGSGPTVLVGSTGTPVTVVNDIFLEVDKAAVLNSGSEEVQVKVIALDKNRNAVAKVPISLAANGDAILVVSSPETDDRGAITAKLTIGSNRSNRTIGVEATANGIVRSTSVQVTGAKLSATLDPALVVPGQSGKIIYRLVDNVGSPMVGFPISVSAPEVTPVSQATGITDSKGEFTFSFTAPAVAPASANVTFNVSAGGATIEPPTKLSVQQAATVGTISGLVRSISVSATPTVVSVNTFGSTSNRTEIRALLVGDDNRPIRNARVWFDLSDDRNNIGGSFTVASSLPGSTATVAYSNDQGIVTTAYVPSTRASPTDGVTIRACYSATDVALPAPAGACTGSATTKITVISEALGVSIGTGGVIEIPADNLTYQRRYIVTVVDGAGAAKAGVPVTAVMDLPKFYTGEWVVLNNGWTKIVRGVCQNEDRNRNGVLEFGSTTEPPENNQVFSNDRLDPGKSDVVMQLIHPRTRADGSAEVLVTYARSFATWIHYQFTVTASGVSGSEFRSSYQEDPAPAPATAFASITVEPPFRLSPYSTQREGCAAPQ
jgi:hypothetical protein